MNKENEGGLTGNKAADDAEALICAYGRKLEPEKKAALLAKIENYRAKIETGLENTGPTHRREVSR